MFGIGATELIVIMVVALLVFGPKRLPELARSLGRGMAEFRRASSDLRQTLQEAEPPPDILKPPETPAQSIAPAAPSQATAQPTPAVAAVAPAADSTRSPVEGDAEADAKTDAEPDAEADAQDEAKDSDDEPGSRSG